MSYRTNPNNQHSDKSFRIVDFHSIRLIYCSHSYEKDRNCKITEVLQPTMIKDLIRLVSEYVSGDIPEDVPKEWVNFFVRSKKQKEISIGNLEKANCALWTKIRHQALGLRWNLRFPKLKFASR